MLNKYDVTREDRDTPHTKFSVGLTHSFIFSFAVTAAFHTACLSTPFVTAPESSSASASPSCSSTSSSLKSLDLLLLSS